MGEPGTVRATTASRFGHDGIDDVAEVTFGMPDGGLALLVSVWHQVLSRPSTRRLELFCEEAFCWTDDDYLGPLHVETTAGEESIAGEPPEWIHRFDLPDEFAIPLAQYAAPTKSFLDALATGTGQGWPDATTALAAHRLVDAAYKSAAANGQLRTAMP
jgi:predicted dehydrogenase